MLIRLRLFFGLSLALAMLAGPSVTQPTDVCQSGYKAEVKLGPPPICSKRVLDGCLPTATECTYTCTQVGRNGDEYVTEPFPIPKCPPQEAPPAEDDLATENADTSENDPAIENTDPSEGRTGVGGD